MCQNVWCSTSKPLLQRNLALQHWSKCPVWSQTLFPASQTRYFFVAPLLPYRRSSAECSVLIDLLVKWNSLEHTEHMHQWWRSRICCRCGLIKFLWRFWYTDRTWRSTKKQASNFPKPPSTTTWWVSDALLPPFETGPPGTPCKMVVNWWKSWLRAGQWGYRTSPITNDSKSSPQHLPNCFLKDTMLEFFYTHI